jgi:hypothetical protein
MGGPGSGGNRLGSGGKGEPDVAMDGPLPDVAMPDGLSEAQQVAWNRLAPAALAQRTLTEATAQRFVLLCKAIALEAQYEAKILADGLTYVAITVDGSGQERETLKAHPLVGAHRGMMQRVEAGMVAFRLAPIGKPLAMPADEKPKSSLEQLQQRGTGLRAVK